MKVFMLNDYEWWAAESLEEAISACMMQCGLSREEAYDENSMGELPDSEMERLQFMDDDGVQRSFKEQLQFMIDDSYPFPCIFATTEF
jgi:hypothetical protein